MPDEVVTTQEVVDTPAIVPDTTPEPDSVDKLPKWVQKMIGDLRSENAKHRTEKTAAEKAAQEAAAAVAAEQGQFKQLYEAERAKSAEAEARIKAAELAAIRAQVGAKLQLPAELQDRLRGETLEDIEADAKLLLAAIPKPAPVTTTDSTSGVNASKPDAGKTDEEIREEAARYGVNFDYLKSYYQSRVKK